MTIRVTATTSDKTTRTSTINQIIREVNKLSGANLETRKIFGDVISDNSPFFTNFDTVYYVSVNNGSITFNLPDAVSEDDGKEIRLVSNARGGRFSPVILSPDDNRVTINNTEIITSLSIGAIESLIIRYHQGRGFFTEIVN